MTERTIGQLVTDIQRDLTGIVRHEVALAKAELKQDAVRGASGAAMFAVAAFLGVVLFLMLCFAAAHGLAAAGLPVWAGFLIVAGVLLLLAGILVLVGRAQVKKVRPPQRTIAAAQATVASLRGTPAPR